MEIDMRESKLDPKVILDRNNWALSVICHKGSNHAEIVIEKMTDDYQYILLLLPNHHLVQNMKLKKINIIALLGLGRN